MREFLYKYNIEMLCKSKAKYYNIKAETQKDNSKLFDNSKQTLSIVSELF